MLFIERRKDDEVDPVTASIIAAVAAGVIGGTGKIGEKLLVDAYEAFKKALKHKLGIDSPVAQAVTSLEAKPDSAARRQVLSEEVIAAGLDKDEHILAAAKNIQSIISSQPDLSEHSQSALGQYIAQADRGSTASINVNQPKDH